MPKRRFNVQEPVIMPPTDDDVRKLIAVADNPRDRCLISFLFSTGLRRKELRNLLISDIINTNEGTKVIVRNTKVKKDRTVPIQTPAIPYLNTWLSSRKAYLARMGMADSGYLFITLKGMQMAAMSIYKVLDAARKKAGVKYRGACHGGGRSCLTSYGRSGIDIGMVKAIAGHSQISTTLRYQRYNDSDKMAAAKKVVRGWG